MLPIALLCLHDGLCVFSPLLPGYCRLVGFPPYLRISAGSVVCLCMFLPYIRILFFGFYYYSSLTSLNLPGTGRIRLPEEQAVFYRELCAVLSRPEIPVFVCVPGFSSMHVWTGKDPLRELGVNGWLWVLDEDEQERVWKAICEYPDIVIVRNRHLIGFYSSGTSVNDSPLMRRVDHYFTPVAVGQGYELLVRR